MNRSEKINALLSIIAGKKTIGDLLPKKTYHWDRRDETYVLRNPDAGETKTEFTVEEYRSYQTMKTAEQLHVIHVAQEGNDPLDDE